MYIDRIKLYNFKIFRHQLIIGNFCPGINIFVGPNGSGKSSLFEAFKILISGNQREVENEFIQKKSLSSKFKSRNFLLVQITFDNSQKLFPIKKKKITLRRLINTKMDKIWISGHSFDTKRIGDFFMSTGIDLKNFFLFLTQKDQLFKNGPNSLLCFEFFEKNSIFFDICEYLNKIFLLFKKSTYLKKKLSSLLTLLIKEKKFQSNEKELSFKKFKINFFFLLLEKAFISFETDFLTKLKDDQNIFRLKMVLRIITIENKLDTIGKILLKLDLGKFIKSNFFKKKKNFLNIQNIYYLTNKKIHFLIKLEKYISVSELIFPQFFWKESFLNQIKIIISKNIYFSGSTEHSFFSFKPKKDFNALFYQKITVQTFKKQQQQKIYFHEYLPSYSFQKSFTLRPNFKYNISKKVFILKQKTLRFLDQFSYEIDFVEKILLNRENNLCKLFGATISRSIKLISTILKNKNIFSDKINGILLDLIVIYRYFEKPVEAFLWKSFSSLIVKDNGVMSLLQQELQRFRNFELNFILNSEIEELKTLNFKNSKIVNFDSIIFSNSKVSPLVKNIVGQTFLCTDSNLASKISKQFSITTVTLNGQIFYSNGMISTNSINSNFSIVQESLTLKKERNVFNWLLNWNKKILHLNNNLKVIYKKQQKLELVFSEVNRFFFSQKKKDLLVNRNCQVSLFKPVFEINFLILLKKLDFFYEKFSKSKKKEKKNFYKKPNSQIKKIIKQILLGKFSLNTFQFLFKKFIRSSNRDIGKRNQFIENFSVNNILYFDYETRKINNKDFLKKFFFQVYKLFVFFQFQSYNQYFFLEKCFFFEKESNKKKKIPKIIIKTRKNDLTNLKNKFIYLGKTKKKIQKFLNQKNMCIKTETNFFIFNLIFFHENLENNLRILYQTFNILIEQKKLELNKTSKLFSREFQKNLTEILPKAKSCTIWKEKRVQKNFRGEIFRKNTFLGLKILVKFETNDPFLNLENMSKGQICLSLLIFCLTLAFIFKKTTLFLDEIDVYMDVSYEKLSSKLIKKFSSKGIQFLIITHKKNMAISGDKWYGISISKFGSLVENVTSSDCKEFLTI